MPVEPEISLLLVDDRPSNLKVLEAGLAHAGYRFVLAQSGKEALALAEREDFAVILLDVQMPEMDGFDVARALRQLPRSRSTPIIFLTAIYPSEDHAEAGYQAGAVDYLFKPINIEVLRAKVAVFVDLHRKTLEIAHQANLLREAERREQQLLFTKQKMLSEVRYARLVDGIRDGIVWAADPQTLRFTYVSRHAERISGYSQGQWRDETDFWWRRIPEEDRPAMREAIERARTTEDSVPFEHRFEKAGGETIWLHTALHIEEAEVGGPLELRGLSVDVTHLKKTEAALREAISVRDEFLSIASHELRTPITPLQLQMQGFMRIVESGKLETIPTETLKDMLRASDAQVARLARLISQLLDVTRLSTGRLTLNTEEIDLGDLVGGVMDQMRYEIRAAEIPLSLDLAKGVRAQADRIRIEQVVINLLTNALKYGIGRPIRASVHVDGEWGRISIADHGIGIAPIDQKRIFERFERAVSPKYFGGLGLGLYISRQIVELHHGRILVESELGNGAVFHVLLPRAGAQSP